MSGSVIDVSAKRVEAISCIVSIARSSSRGDPGRPLLD